MRRGMAGAWLVLGASLLLLGACGQGPAPAPAPVAGSEEFPGPFERFDSARPRAFKSPPPVPSPAP